MAYTRKTRDEYEIQVHSCHYGWEMVTTESTWRDAKDQLRLYSVNAPGYAYQIVKKRVRIKETSNA